MHGAHAFLVALAVVLGVAAVTTVLFQKLRQPVVLGYILAGIVVGPHVPIPLVADPAIVQTLSELGVILLMFALGLEFSLGKLVKVGPTAGVTAIVQSSLVLWLGFLAGRLLGWTVLESLFAGAAVAISSTTIIAKAFDELGVKGRLRDLVVGVLVVEDLVAILLMALLTTLAKGAGLSADALLVTLAQLVGFLVVLLGAGMLVVPRAVRWVRRIGRPETTLVAVLGLCFGVALLAQEVGYSVALGAFIAGSLVAESGEAHAIEELVRPVRDVFAAVFFVSVGMLLDFGLLARHAGAVALFTGIVVGGKLVGVTAGAFLTGQGTRTSVQAAMSLAQIGEFSFIIAGLGLSLGATREFLYPVAVSVSAITTLTTPWLIRASGPAASWVDRRLPRPLQTVAALYGSWLERVRQAPAGGTAAAATRRALRVLAIDAAVLAALVIGAALAADRAGAAIAARLEAELRVVRWGVAVLAAAAALPFLVGILRNARRFGEALAASALPGAEAGKTDLGAAPRRTLALTIQLATVFAVSVPVVAVTQPFLPGAPGAAFVALLLAVLGVAVWRGATGLQGHVKASAQAMVEALARQARPEDGAGDPMAQVRALFPGLGDPVAVRLGPASPACGRSLAELDLRGLTGATVLAIWRPDGAVTVPSAREVLRAGDVLALAGSGDAVAAARWMLQPEGEGAAA
ncbi:MAG: cation:proton antiporter [Anaeromyxobacter sp.]